VSVIFMGLGIPKVYEQPIPEQLGDMPIVALDNFSTHPLICTHHVTPVFRVELSRQGSRVHEVTEHDSEVASFRIRRRWHGWCESALGSMGLLHGKWG
jgi:hypothetical protein